MDFWIIASYGIEKVVQDIKASLKKSNLKAKIVYFQDLQLVLENGRENLYHKNKKIIHYPKVIYYKRYDLKIAEHFEAHGVKIINGAQELVTVANKYKTHLLLSSIKGVKQAKMIYSSFFDYDFVVKKLSSPFVVKYNRGMRGCGVYLVNTKEEFELAIKSIDKLEILCQEYIKESKGKDIRICIIDNNIVGCIMRKSPNDNEFRSNIALGGLVYKINVPKRIRKQAIEIAKKLNMEVCFVDYMLANKKYILCEVNGNVTASDIRKATGVDIYEILFEYIKTKYLV